ncbi:D-inositol 3-phosphate glycosyltransferase [Caulifigura coniformis]|uniref:D-inositol 3-phosphate glycosyltransferase n=1 Tax=Caulifigura coniformis TaxID=2527983 RepID=A0A517SHZ8_9PLAN|nr:glycosyltransferase family 4 protein [Caulifigura coniformis]QDT55750.1 D-inositol 3-phosphate glycosyltransferase [Caulifigura coniformis]
MSSGLGHIARGIETWADSVATELDRRGVGVTLFKGGGHAERPFERVVRCLQRRTKLADFLVRMAPSAAWRVGLHQTYDLEQTTFALAILPHLIRKRYDLIHLQDPWLAYILEKTKSLHGASVILGHGTEEEPWLLRKFQHVQELSPFYLSRHGDLEGRQWFAVPNFVDAGRFQPGDKAQARREFGLPEDALIVFCCAALNRSKKRLDWLAQEFARVGRSDMFLVLAGARDPESAELTREIHAQLGSRVRILENVPHSKMPLLHRAADVHVMCSLMEVMGISILESMASGVANVGHQWGSVEWVIGPTGRIVDMEKPGALASTLRALNLETCRELGQEARRRVLDLFSVEAVVDQMLGMYDDVLKTRAGHRREDARRVSPGSA